MGRSRRRLSISGPPERPSRIVSGASLGRLGGAFENRGRQVQDGAPRPVERVPNDQSRTYLIDGHEESCLLEAPMQRPGLHGQRPIDWAAAKEA